MEATMVHSRKSRLALLASSVLMLAACSAEEESGSLEQFSDAEQAPDSASIHAPVTAEGEASEALADVAITVPRMAYVFDYAFRLPGEEIAPLQLRHADMCEALGPTRCQIVGMTASGNEEDEATGRLELAVASDRARGFVTELSALAEGFHGEQVSAQITGEDLTKSLVDTEAHLRSRTELRDRLLEVLRTRRGTVAELVEAERGVAAINAEIDQARSWMAEMRGRVSFSRVVLNYQSSTPVGMDFTAPVSAAFGSLGWILGRMAALLIVLSGVAAPFVLGMLGLRWWQRRREREAVAG
jgi:hypothetical protein